MRRIALLVLVAILAACGGDDGSSATDESTVPDRSRPVPEDVRDFLDRVTDPASVAFTARYDLLTKNGGSEHTVDVTSRPPTVEVSIDGTPVDLENEAALSSFGIFSGFLAANPAAAVEAAARRTDAGDAVLSTRDAAGVHLECISVPVQGAQTSIACLTPEGVIGFVDNPSARYELSSYAPG